MIEEALPETSALSVGQLLKAARVTRDLSIEVVAKSLRISKRHLSNLEEDHETLICDVYTLGFLRSYAQFLEVDQDDLIVKFKKQTAPPQPSHLTFPVPLPERGMPSFRILALSLFAFLVMIFMGWEWYGYYGSPPYVPEEIAAADPPLTIEESLPVQKETSDLNFSRSSQVEEINPPIQNPPSALSSAASIGVLLKTTEESWVEVKDKDGHIILNRLFGPGDSYEFKNPQGLVLKTGNAKGISLISGERKRVFPENSGIVKSNIPLDPQKWVEQNPETH